MGTGADARRPPAVTEPTTPAWLEEVIEPTPEEAAAARAVLDTRPGVRAAMADARASRADLANELERLEAAARAAVDVKARVKRNPAKAAGAAAGIGFVALGGPRKVFRRAKSAVFGKPDPLPDALLPEEIDKALRALGSDGAKVRGAVERDFAAYLEQAVPARRNRRSIAIFVLLPLARVLILRFGRQLIDELLSSREGFGEQLEKVRARQAAGPTDLGRAHRPNGPDRADRPGLAGRRSTRGRAVMRHSPTGEWRNGRRAGLRSRCRVSGVSVRARPRLPAPGPGSRRPPTLYSRSDASDCDTRPQELRPPRDRGPRRQARSRRARRRRPPVPPDARGGLPAR